MSKPLFHLMRSKEIYADVDLVFQFRMGYKGISVFLQETRDIEDFEFQVSKSRSPHKSSTDWVYGSFGRAEEHQSFPPEMEFRTPCGIKLKVGQCPS